MRTRSVLLDNSSGTIYSNQDNENIIISGIALQSQRYDQDSKLIIQNITASTTTQFSFPNDTTFKNIKLTTATPAKNTRITIALKFRNEGQSVFLEDTSFNWDATITNNIQTFDFAYYKKLTANSVMQFSVNVASITKISGTNTPLLGTTPGKGLSVILEYYSG